MSTKAIIQMDGQELSLLINILIKKSKEEMTGGSWHWSEKYLQLADKLGDAKEDLYYRRSGIEEKPALQS